MRAAPSIGPAGVEAYPVDPDFPQLPTATDPARMLDVFRRHLRAPAGDTPRILACTPFRFRCRQTRTRCVLQYTLRIADPATGRERDQWVTGVLYAGEGEAERAHRRLHPEAAAAEIPAAWRSFEPVSLIPELDMMVEVFPFDRRLPQLGRVMGATAGRIDPLLHPRLGAGPWQEVETSLEPARYRTELGAVLRYRIEAREAGSARTAAAACYLKVYRNQNGLEAFDLLNAWSRRPDTDRLEYTLVPALAYLHDHRTLVIEEAPGTSLREILLREDDSAGALGRLARAVAEFAHHGPGLTREHTLADQLDQLGRASALVEWACPDARDTAREITAMVTEALRPVSPSPFHGDLKADHVFVSGGRMAFIDIDAAALGDPVRDVAHFCSYLVAGVGLESLPRERRRRLAQGFVEEYFRSVPPAWRRQFHLHLAGALVEVASGIFRHQRPGWRERAEAAVEEGHRALRESWIERSVARRRPLPGPGPAVEWSALPGLAPADSPSGLQLALLQGLWAGGEVSAHELMRGLRQPLAPARFSATMSHLERAGIVTHRMVRRRKVWRATVDKADLQRSLVADLATLADRLFEGDVAALVCQLVQTRDANARDLGRVIALLQARERELERNGA